jgi:TolA-binding protein
MKANEHDEHDPDSQANNTRERASRQSDDRGIVPTSDPNIEVGWSDDANPLGLDETIVAKARPVTQDIPIHVQLANVAVDRDQKSQQKLQGAKLHESRDGNHQDLRKQYETAYPRRSGWMDLVLTGVVALACGLGGAWAFSYFESKNKDQSKGGDHAGKGKNDSVSSANSQVSNEGNDGNSSNNPDNTRPAVSKQVLDDLQGQMKGLSSEIAKLQERFDTFAGLGNDTARDIGALQVKIKEVSHSIEEIGNIPKRMQPLEERVNRLQLVADELNLQLAGRKTIRAVAEIPAGDDKRKVVTTAGSAPTQAAPSSPNTPDATMTAAISFFKKGQYIQANHIFDGLQVSKAGDARVWYYSALANGLVTGKWDGETKRFVTSGAERESAGSPPTAEIDAAFSTLTVEQGKDWLAAYRAQLVKH